MYRHCPPSVTSVTTLASAASVRQASSKGTSRSVSSFTFVLTAMVSSSRRLCAGEHTDDQVPARSIQHQPLDAVQGGLADLIQIGIPQQQLELLANALRVARTNDHATQRFRTARVRGRGLTGMEAVRHIPLDDKREGDRSRTGI